ncbi:unnamed protein product [Calypogeia fissa]
MSGLDCHPTTNEAAGSALSIQSKVLETGAGLVQNLGPVKSVCAHLNAFHVYGSDPSRCVEANHYCMHVNEDVRQCIIYDSPGPKARLIGVEYMISRALYETLDKEERKLWHSHAFEVKSGMLIMPGPDGLPDSVWEQAETAEMKNVIGIYGKTWHFWQVDRGDKLPLGRPELMMSYTAEDQLDFEKIVGERDARFGTDWKHKKEIRESIEVPPIHEDADSKWKKPSGDLK